MSSAKQSEKLTCRRILFTMVTSGFIINALLKTVFNITIVAMAKKENSNSTESFDWDESQKQNILGIFFWGFAITKIPSGTLAEMFGSRAVLGYSMTLAALLTIITPSIARYDYYALLTSRVAMGFLVGATWPAIMPLTSSWVPPDEQSVFLSCVSSSSLGYMLSLGLGGFLTSKFGWPSVFYISGGVSLLWSIIWFYLVYDSPEKHPRISSNEKEEIEEKMNKSRLEKKKIKFGDIPWKSIFLSAPVWAIVIAQISSFLGNMTIATELSSYLDQVLHYDITKNGLLSALPHCGVFVASLTYGYIADRLLKSRRLSTTAVRRIFGGGAIILPSIFMVTLGFWGEDAIIAMFSFCIAMILNAACTAGHCPNMLDISPNFSGTICGLVNMLSAFAVYFATKFLAMLLINGQTFQEWRVLWWTLGATYLFGGLVYLFLCSGKLQSWDSKKKEKNWDEVEPLEVKYDLSKDY